MDSCAEQHITFTRARPYRKNDGCFVEQKNWAVVRLVGHPRLEVPALGALERTYELAGDHVDFLHPCSSWARRCGTARASTGQTHTSGRPTVPGS